MKKNAFTLVELMAIIVIMASMLLIILPAINNTIKNSEEKKKQDALNNIYMAAENYVMANYDEYLNLDNVGAVEYVYIVDLISNNYLSIDTVNPNNDLAFTNQDTIKVTKKEDGTLGYELIYLKTLIETLMEQYQEGNQKGLVKDSSNPNLFYYTGTNEEVSNNFLWYGGHQWRVLEFDTSAKTLTLITQQPLTAISPASAVWETEEAYNNSYINKWLNDYFWNSLDSSIQGTIQNSTFNIGIYTDVDEITTTKKVGLLDEDQYKRAGNADSFLDIKDNWWLGNRYSSSDIRSVYVGNLYNVGPADAYGVRAVIKISDITITGGDGTLVNNYQVANKATNTNNVQVGEYINVPYSGSDNACGSDNMCTFRVISKDNDSIKVVLNGLLPTTSQYGSSVTISTSHTIYTPLNTFAEGISDAYRYTGNKTFYIGDYPYVSGTDQNYEDVQDETLEASVGLPTVGEMFSGNDIDMGSAKTFVDVNTIENPTASFYSFYYWTMNRYSSSYVRGVNDIGNLYYSGLTYAYGVRAVIYLKSGLAALDFTGGEGTPQSPYELQ